MHCPHNVQNPAIGSLGLSVVFSILYGQLFTQSPHWSHFDGLYCILGLFISVPFLK